MSDSTSKGLLYLRRSGKRQEQSLDNQLAWALSKARELGVALDATAENLEHMRKTGLTTYKSIRLDDGRTGSDLQRPGLLRLLEDATTAKGVTHVFIYKRDRLARPEQATEAMQLEASLSRAGVTIVLEGQVLPPTKRGERNASRDLQAYLDYNASGEFLELHAERIIHAHTNNARKGYSTGGNPPYGFVRALYGPDDELVEILPPGKTVRQEGHHVRWIPGPDEESRRKIQIWLEILRLTELRWGAKRIANHLTEIGAPTPSKGKVRTDQGVQHRLSDAWNHRTVLELINNPLIVGDKTYAKRSGGKHRRLGEKGPRVPEASEWTDEGAPRIVKNPKSVVVTASNGSDPQFDKAEWEMLQRQRESRGASQKGIPRAKDPSKYPLSCRVYDQTEECGAPMHALTAGGRALYKCSRYMKTCGAECASNSVDAEALFSFTLSAIQKLVGRSINPQAIRRRVEEIARASVDQEDSAPSSLDQIDQEISALERDYNAVRKNMAREDDETIYGELKVELTGIREQLEQKQQVRKKKVNEPAPGENMPIDDQVEQAMALLGNLERVVSDPDARVDCRRLFDQLNLRVGLNFVDAIKGKKRIVRRLASGVLAFGDAPLPVPIHGKDTIEEPPVSPSKPGRPDEETDSKSGTSKRQRKSGPSSLAYSGDPIYHQEGISITKVSRADRI